MSERVYETARVRYPDAPAIQLDLKGKTELVSARIVTQASDPPHV